jgi:hypothetical protein
MLTVPAHDGVAVARLKLTMPPPQRASHIPMTARRSAVARCDRPSGPAPARGQTAPARRRQRTRAPPNGTPPSPGCLDRAVPSAEPVPADPSKFTDQVQTVTVTPSTLATAHRMSRTSSI